MSRLGRSRIFGFLAGVAILSACGKGGGSPAAPSRGNGMPTVTVNATPSTTALAASTVVTFTASATDPDGDPLTYNWAFGDGEAGSGASVTHVYRSAGTYNATVTVTDGKGGSATAAAPVVVRSLNGRWRSEARAWIFELTQNGSSLSGVLIGFKDQIYTNPPPLTGTITSGGRIQFTSGAFSISFSGTVSSTVNSIPGTLFDCANNCRDYGESLTRL